MKKFMTLALVLVIAVSLVACGYNGDTPTSSDVLFRPINTGVVIEYDINIIMNIYDIRVSVDDSILGTQVQGEKKLYELSLTEGTHEIVFAEVGDGSNKITKTFTVSEGNYYYFFIKARNSGIMIEKEDALTLDEVQVLITNPATDNDDSGEPVEGEEQTTTDSSSVNGSENSSSDENVLPESNEELANFPVEYAMRAAVVAFTNCFADDTFKEDGDTLDVAKFHSYADTSGFFMHVTSKGDWSVKNETAWHVEHLKLRVNVYDTIVDASLDVSYDGENYIVSNLAGKAPSYDDNSDLYSNMSVLEQGNDAKLYLTVPFKLIEDDRVNIPDNKQNNPIKDKDFDSYFGAMEGLIAISEGIIIEFQTLKQDDYSIIRVIVGDAWYNSEEYQKERFAEALAAGIDEISKETGVSDSVSVYFYDAYGKKLAEPKLLGGYKIVK